MFQPKMKTFSFQAVIKDIEGILGVAVVNEEKEKQQAEETTK